MDVASKRKKKNKQLQSSTVQHEVLSSVSKKLPKSDVGVGPVKMIPYQVKLISDHTHVSSKRHRKSDKCKVKERDETDSCTTLAENTSIQAGDPTNTSVILSRTQQRRIANKKKKAAALLDLIKQSEECKRPNIPSVPSKTSKIRGKHKAEDSHYHKSVTDLKQVKHTDDSKTVGSSNHISDVLMSSGSSCSSDSETAEPIIPQVRPVLTADELQELRKKIRARQLEATQWPKFFLTLLSLDDRTTLYMQDLHQLINYALLKERCNCRPKWCKLLRPMRISNVVVVILEGLSATDYNEHRNSFPCISSKFDQNVEMVPPAVYNSSVIELLHVSINRGQLDEALKNNALVPKSDGKHCVVNHGINVCHDKQSSVQVDKELSDGVPLMTDHVGAHDDAFPRTMLLLSPSELLDHSYPIPGYVNNPDLEHDLVFTKNSYTPVKATSPLFAVDCEMCFTTAQKLECTRVSIVDENLACLCDRLVKPRNPIINYLTQYSGITKSMLAPVHTKLQDVQKLISQLLPPDAILCGQSLDSDLKALRMYHPYVIDTSVIYNLSGNTSKTSLKALTSIFLKKNIQVGNRGHCSIEDASATMQLVKLKLSKNPTFGDVRAGYVFDGTEGKNISGIIPQPSSSDTQINSTTDIPVDSASNGEIDDYSKKCDGNKLKQLKQLKAFFSPSWKPNIMTNSLFSILDQLNVPVNFLDRPCVTKLYRDSNLNNITVKDSTSDKKLIKMAKTCISETVKSFTWVHLYGYQKKVIDKERQETDYIRKHLAKMDAKAADVISAAPAKSLCIIVMPGRVSSTKDSQHDACACITIQR